MSFDFYLMKAFPITEVKKFSYVLSMILKLNVLQLDI